MEKLKHSMVSEDNAEKDSVVTVREIKALRGFHHLKNEDIEEAIRGLQILSSIAFDLFTKTSKEENA